jgi:phosphohistidine phosphatase
VKTLLVLRHAKSSWKNHDLADHDRPLNKRGKKDAKRIGKLILEQALVPELILSSSAKRAQKTALRVADDIEFDGTLTISRELYSFGYEAYLEMLSELPRDINSVMIIGHNPGLEELIEALIGEYRRMTTASLAQIIIDIEEWAKINEEPEAKLTNLWTPKNN